MNSTAWIFVSALPLALLIDRDLGEPSVRWHPVVWMGNYLNRASSRIHPNPSPEVLDLKAFTFGAVYWCAGAAIVLVVAVTLQWVILKLPLVLAALLRALAVTGLAPTSFCAKRCTAWLLSRKPVALSASV